MARPLFLLCYLLAVDAINDVDNRLTVQRPGYGVMFEKEADLLDSGGSTTYTHTWTVAIPHLRAPYLASPKCDRWSWSELQRACGHLQSVIESTFQSAVKRINSAASALDTALTILPLSTLEDLQYNDFDDLGSDLQDANLTRRRRSVPPIDSLDTDNDDKFTEFLDHTPVKIGTQIVADLVSIPGPRTIRQLKSSLRSLGGAIQTNTNSIIHFSNSLTSAMNLVDLRLDTIETRGQIIHDDIGIIKQNMETLANSSIGAINEIAQKLSYLQQMKDYYTSIILPAIISYNTVVNDIVQLAGYFANGFNSLNRGYLSSALVPEEMIVDLLDYITTEVVATPRYKDYLPISLSPLYYYQIKDIAYARTTTHIIITINIPMIKVGGRMNIYKVNLFPVPINAGTFEKDSPGYTRLMDMPDFLAVTDDRMAFLEIRSAEYLTCRGDDMKICGGIGAAYRSKSSMSCAMAIFLDSHIDIKTLCTVAYTKNEPTGGAVQIAADDNFVAHRGRDDVSATWQLSCPHSAVKPEDQIPACDMCRIKVPCGCTLTAAHFTLPTRMTGCNPMVNNIPNVTIINTRNTALLAETLSSSELARIRSQEAIINDYFPPMKKPTFNFTDPYEGATEYAEVFEDYRVDFRKAVTLWKQQREMYVDKVDSGLAKAKDFSDVVVDRAPSIARGLSTVVTEFLGGSVGTIVFLLTSPLFLGIIGFCLTGCKCLPLYLHRRRTARYRRERRLINHYRMVAK
jgi:hypothetical protein